LKRQMVRRKIKKLNFISLISVNEDREKKME